MKDVMDLHAAIGADKLLEHIHANCEVIPSGPPFVDLGELVRAGIPREVPTVAPAFDGKCLLYRARLNEVHAEPATGKTNVACAFAVSVVKAGGVVLYCDPEDVPHGIASRLSSFGLTADELSASFKYLHNPTPEDYVAAQLWAQFNPCTLVVVDGLAEALAAEGKSEDSPLDVLPFFRARLRPFAEAGAAVLVSDHVAKNAETRGKWMRGSGSKMGRYDGAVYELAIGEPYTRDKAGFIRLKIAKDRCGGVGTAGEIAAELHFRPDGERTEIEWKSQDSTPFRPTALIEKIEKHLRINPDASLTDLRRLGGKGTFIDKALACMIDDGDLEVEPTGKGKRNRYILTK